MPPRVPQSAAAGSRRRNPVQSKEGAQPQHRRGPSCAAAPRLPRQERKGQERRGKRRGKESPSLQHRLLRRTPGVLNAADSITAFYYLIKLSVMY